MGPPRLDYRRTPIRRPEDSASQACAHVLFAVPVVVAVISTYHTAQASSVVVFEMLYGVPLALVTGSVAVLLMPNGYRLRAIAWWLVPWLATMALIIWNGAHCSID